MGVPKLFQIILEKFPKSHSKVNGQIIDYLFIDFNSIIYESYEKVKKQAKANGRNLNQSTYNQIEDLIIKQVIAITREMIHDVVKPKKMVYFAFDGPPPRGKMTQQRDRRYKKLYEDAIKKKIQEKHGVVDPVGEPWSTTRITPGTEFMMAVSQAMNQAIKNGVFPSNLEYVLSDTSVAGEGEHKFLKFLDQLAASRICIYSNDGDVLMLVNRFPQHEAYVLTQPRDTSRIAKKFYGGEKYLYLVISGLNEGFEKQFFKLDLEKIDLRRLKFDYIFFTMIGGNDFVQHLYFLRMKDEHSFKVMKWIYMDLFPKHGHLIGPNLEINQPFLLDYLIALAKQELSWLKKKQIKFQNPKSNKHPGSRSGSTDSGRSSEMEDWELEWEEFQHSEYYKKSHPLYHELKDEFKKIDYFQQPNQLWKKQYYQEFFNTDYNDKKAINRICYQYLKSWVYTLRYYLDELPSWSWYYPYHASPLPSDLVKTLQRIKDINTVFKFDKGSPFRPLDQLILILPKETDLLSQKFIKVMDKFPQYYPSKFKLDILWGQKFIYSEPDLPNINAHEVLNETKKLTLTKREKDLNRLYKDPLYYPAATK